MRARSGITILELVVVLSLSIILGAIAIGSYVTSAGSFERANARKNIIGDLTLARVSARSKNARVILKLLSDGSCSSGYEIGYDFFPFNISQTATIEERFQRVCFDKDHVSVTISNPPGIQRMFFNQDGILIDYQGQLTNLDLSFSHRSQAFLTVRTFPLGSNLCINSDGGSRTC